MTIMHQRFAGQTVMERLLIEQESVGERSRLARMFGISPLAPASESWYYGALGEIAVGERLSGLPSEWTVMHAVPVNARGIDVDHLVIGPAGVFTVTTTPHRRRTIWAEGDRFVVDGHEQQHIRHSLIDRGSVQDLVPHIRVRPVIALVDPERVSFGDDSPAVDMIDARRITRWLTGLPRVIDDGEIAALVATLEQPNLWHNPATADHSLLERFGSLDRTVRKAAYRRAVWGIAAAGTAAVLLFETMTHLV